MTARKTKRACRDAFMTLIHERPYRTIAVGDIAQVAGISRKTFYNYFRSKYELVNWILYSEMTKIRKAPLDQGVWVAFKSFLDFFDTDRAFFSEAISDASPDALGRYYTDLLHEIFFPALADGFRSSLRNEEEIDRAVTLLAETGRILTVRWLDDPRKPSASEFIGFLHRCLDALAAMSCAERSARESVAVCAYAECLLGTDWAPVPQPGTTRLAKPDSPSRLPTAHQVIQPTRTRP